MNLIDILAQAQGGNAVRNMSRQFGLDDKQTRSALEQLAPMIAAGVRRNSQQGNGMVDLIGALQGGNHARHVDMDGDGIPDDMVNDGNNILGHIFGSKDVSRAVAAQAADSTGIGSGILKQMLPIIASMIMGSMSKKTQEPGMGDIIGDLLGGALGGTQSQNAPGGGMLGQILGGLLKGGAKRQAPQPAQRRSQAREPSLQDIFGSMLDDTSSGNAADDLLDSVLRQTRG